MSGKEVSKDDEMTVDAVKALYIERTKAIK
jgi:hypothetical protein